MPRNYLDPPLPIMALATAPGEAALSLVRAAGPGCIGLVAAVFSRPAALLAAPGHGLVHGELRDPASGETVDEVLLAVFRAPRSPTGEDQVELSCHGSPAVTRRVLALLESAGFAPALPGEFAFRAFVNGKTDLVRAEAMNELVRSRGDAARADALARLEGGLSRRLADARAGLLGLLAETELRLDYGEDEAEGDVSAQRLRALRDSLAALASTWTAGRLIADGLVLVLAGAPNAGKSSLFNLFLREERSIVSPEPGTTRDWIEAEVELEGLRLRLVDTAGLREAEGGVEAEGVARSGRKAASADLLLYLVDSASADPRGEDGLSARDRDFLERHPHAIRVWSRVDLAPRAATGERAAPPPGFLGLSAATGEGFPELAAAVGRSARALVSGLAGAGGSAGRDGRGDGIRVGSERQKLLLDRAVASLDAALGTFDRDEGLDILALDLREAAESLGEISGEITTPEILETLFSTFCVGK